MSAKRPKILLTGATGYVGGRLLKKLEGRGYPLRCMARRPEFLRKRVCEKTEVLQGDALKKSSLEKALEGIDVAFYLMHSLASKNREFEGIEKRSAENFAKSAQKSSLSRIIFLGGIGHPRTKALSPHLKSRQEVGEILRSSTVQVIELRSSIILGGGSISYEIIRALAERLPAMICPNWVRVDTQPIFVEDVLDYLLDSIELKTKENEVVEIGGKDRLPYYKILLEYARIRKLRRRVLIVPVLTARLSALWLALITPVYARVGRKLIEGIRNDTCVRSKRAQELFDITPMGVTKALRISIEREKQHSVETNWTDSTSATLFRKKRVARVGNRLVEQRHVVVKKRPEKVFDFLIHLGGKRGWMAAKWLWQLRGGIDLLFGGVGMRSTKYSHKTLREGQAVDFWRVVRVTPHEKLVLEAEMKLPGNAWLDFEVRRGKKEGESLVYQTAIFDPVGLFGLIYWYSIYPFHWILFKKMLKNLKKEIEGRP